MKNNFECLNKTMMGTDIFVALNQAMTRQFAGTFTSSVENITAAVNDILESLDRFGFKRTVFLNSHGDNLQRTAMLNAIIESNKKLNMKSYWPEYEDDVPHMGFRGDEDYLIKITPMQLDEAYAKSPFDTFYGERN